MMHRTGLTIRPEGNHLLNKVLIIRDLWNCTADGRNLIIKRMFNNAKEKRKQKIMEKFLIEVPHGADKGSCMRAIQVFMNTGSHFVTHADWGCMDGEHKAWLIVEVEDKEAARRILPAAYQQKAKITKLHRFTREEIGHPEQLLEQHSG